jgi:uncharacterized protein YbaP (TraB family)
MRSRTLRWLFCCGSAILVATSSACASGENATGQSLLWRITSPQGAVSHVFGTIHIADSTVFKQRDTVLQILDISTSYASELNLDSVMRQLSPQALLLERGTLYDIFDSSDVNDVCQSLSAVNSMLSSACTRLKPGAIMMIVTMGSVSRTAPSSIDEFLWARAKKLQLKRHGLETVAEQLSVMDSMPPAYVLEQLRSRDSLAVELEKMRRLYVSEDLDAMRQYSDAESGMDSTMLAMVNDRRNMRMVERMEPLIDTGGAFIAIGALHLTGPSGIPQLLQRRGYRVEPVTGGVRVNWLERGKPEKRR